MTKPKHLKPVKDWTGHTLYQRLQECRLMLYLHGFLTLTENVRVSTRLRKYDARETQAAKGGA